MVDLQEVPTQTRHKGIKKSFYLGIGLFLLIYAFSWFPDLLPANLSSSAVRMLALTVLVAVFWVSETIPIPATSIIPLFLLPFLGIMPSKEVAVSYGSDIVLLFMTGFFIAIAIEKWNLHRRIALHIIHFIGVQPHRIALGFMMATALISMWISNTATTLMMLPIAAAVIKEVTGNNLDERLQKRFGTVLMLGIAYGASIGGVGTPVGSPPNLIFLAQMQKVFPDRAPITFFQWMLIGIPIVFILMPLAWWYLTHISMKLPKQFTEDARTTMEAEFQSLGRMRNTERVVAILFALTAFLWIFRADISFGTFVLPGWAGLLGLSKFVEDTTVAATIAVLMFLLPVRTEEGRIVNLLTWDDAVHIPWGILLLFGGGLAISDGFAKSGLSEYMASSLQIGLQGTSVIFMLVGICTFMTFLTEVTSNTAVTTLMMPILATTAPALNIDPIILMWPAAISASFAFMLPVGTPPNAIVYSQGYFPISTMAKTGFVMNIAGIILVTGLMYYIVLPMMGLT